MTMMKMGRVGLMTAFPDFKAKGFRMDTYNQQFQDTDVIIAARGKQIDFPEHWGGLSVKCSFGGKEFYQGNNSFHAVDDDHFLLFNEGKYYTSWIDAATEVESFTVNVSPLTARDASRALTDTHSEQLDDPFRTSGDGLRFTEKMYQHNGIVTPVLARMRTCTQDFEGRHTEISELFFELIDRLLVQQQQTNQQIAKVEKLRPGTRAELFSRLARAKDFIYSNYHACITIEQMADVACLNQFYFLREFRKLFRQTPHQVLTDRRLEVARLTLLSTSRSVSEICQEVGFSDLASFSKLFKKTVGISPNQFRMTRKSVSVSEVINPRENNP